MKTAGLIFGILSILGMLLGFIPCFGAFNWLNIPFAVVGLILSIVGYNQEKKINMPTGTAVTGIVLCAIAIVFGGIRLILGAGVV
ncbi:hypothetical protein [Pedobacter punctiformis]|uniref:DUF4190 domain-containing protein n=1 Tax=Pedobacter punctiformis TaxID=3004097 RepID=A0ABT4L6A5_9SPHI|nr:hypothetical protein [Pedobacter sp. HCMS5-2]MCZ4243450.1 hypothetical protein [Pedobacter sp. HCMS5-2]